MTTDKTPATLATVKHGGCVQLGDWLPLLPPEVDAVRCMIRGEKDMAEACDYYYTADQMRDYARAALSKRIGQDGTLTDAARAAIPFVAYAFSEGVTGAEEAGRAIEAALAARQQVGEPVARLIEAVEGECEGLAISRDTAASILAHVFPGGRVAAAYMVDGRIEQGLFFDRAAAETMAAMNAGEVVPLFRSPAQAVDLGQFRDVVADWRDRCCRAADKDTILNMAKADRLLALIDGKAVGK